MAWNETLVTIVGTLTTDVTHRHTAEGVSTARFRIASTERRYNKEAQDWVDGETLYLAVSCWRRLADNARATLAKSDPVMVRGRLRIKSFETEGVRKQYAEIEAVSISAAATACTAHPR